MPYVRRQLNGRIAGLFRYRNDLATEYLPDNHPDLVAWRMRGEWGDLRRQRNAYLAASDWTQIVDAPLTSAQRTAWRDYRQALRDLPANTTDPTSPGWPTKPRK